MNDEKIEGLGSIHGGDYNDIIVDGMGKLKGKVTAKRVKVSGTLRSNGNLVAEEVSIEGFGRVYKSIKVKKLRIDGLLKLRRADLNADFVYNEGLLTSTGAINADEIKINGYCTVKRMMGDTIIVHNDLDGMNKLVRSLRLLCMLYFGRDINLNYSLVDHIDCTVLKASGLKSKVVYAENVELGNNCRIGTLYCDGKMSIDPSCRIKKVISNNKVISKNQKGCSAMSDVTVKKILDLYKNSTITEEEAELMLSSIYQSKEKAEKPVDQNTEIDTPWEEDGKLRIVAFLGKRLLKKGDAGQYKFDVKYEGEALAVDCQGSLTCGDVSGHVSAGGSIHCADIGGDASCWGSITCSEIGGSVSAGGSVNI